MKEHRATAIGFLTALAMLAAGCETARVAPPASIPERLAVPPNQTVARMFHVNGVQIYDCQTNHDDARRVEWVFRAPEAELRDSRGHLIGRHYAGPTWEALDGSKIVGEVAARSDSADPTAIPWLLLRAKSSSGRGIFGRTVSVQRLNTSGGKAPASGCDQTQIGKEARVPYSADYYFYDPAPTA